jgi:bacterioferritin
MNPKLIELLNSLLIQEQTSINQYRFNSEWNKVNGYNELSDMFYERYKDESKHYHHIIARILLLEGLPVIDDTGEPKIAYDVKTQLENDLEIENQIISDYNNAIHILTCGNDDIQPDNETRRILEKILRDEEEHVQEIQGNLKKIADVGIDGYLTIYGK